MSFITDMFGGGAPAQVSAAVPAVTPPVPMPDIKGNKDAKRRSIAEQLRRQGRASTILTDQSQSDTLGG